MKAIIEFEIEDLDNEEDTKNKLIQDFSQQLQDWLDGKGIINIKFVKDDKKDNDYTKINWITDKSIN
tara:strand:- start:1203 stop:1403 length:201 start_codon:yes stop_codon:yes gene_type:complete